MNEAYEKGRKAAEFSRGCWERAACEQHKPWKKATTNGRLYLDTKHPEFKKWFIEQIEKYSKLNIHNVRR